MRPQVTLRRVRVFAAHQNACAWAAGILWTLAPSRSSMRRHTFGLLGAYLLAGNLMAQHDYDTNLKAKEEIELLITINREQLAILRELTNIRGS